VGFHGGRAPPLEVGAGTRRREILDEALADARDHIDPASPERVRAFVAIATQMIQLDRARTWEVMLEVVKASNAAKEFTGEDARIRRALQTRTATHWRRAAPSSRSTSTTSSPSSPPKTFRARSTSRSTFEGESPRAFATLAVARSVLAKGGKL
jgi:hypothetical protein